MFIPAFFFFFLQFKQKLHFMICLMHFCEEFREDNPTLLTRVCSDCTELEGGIGVKHL